MIVIDITGARAVGKSYCTNLIKEVLEKEGYQVFINKDAAHSSCTMRDQIATASSNMVVLITDGGRYGDDDRDLDEDWSME